MTKPPPVRRDRTRVVDSGECPAAGLVLAPGFATHGNPVRAALEAGRLGWLPRQEVLRGSHPGCFARVALEMHRGGVPAAGDTLHLPRAGEIDALLKREGRACRAATPIGVITSGVPPGVAPRKVAATGCCLVAALWSARSEQYSPHAGRGGQITLLLRAAKSGQVKLCRAQICLETTCGDRAAL